MVRKCAKCQEYRLAPIGNPVRIIDQPDSRFHVIHLDCISPMLESGGHQFALTVIDRFTGYIVIQPMGLLTFVETINAFLASWLGFFGFPHVIVTNNESNFVDQFMHQNIWNPMSRSKKLDNGRSAPAAGRQLLNYAARMRPTQHAVEVLRWTTFVVMGQLATR